MVQTLAAHTSEGKRSLFWAPSLEIPLVYELPRTRIGFRAQLVKVLKGDRCSESLIPILCGAYRCQFFGGNIVHEQQLVEKRNGDLCLNVLRFLPDDVFWTAKILFPWWALGIPQTKLNPAFKRNGNKTLGCSVPLNGQDIVRIKDCPLFDKSNQKASWRLYGALSYLRSMSLI